ncbi:MAG: hypothetical protein QOI66_4002, partial [Myxococcales bacterium]|nr:hypothetical protein [Myxococcales bacterium]
MKMKKALAPVMALLAFSRFSIALAADELRVASKSFTESVILGEIATLT